MTQQISPRVQEAIGRAVGAVGRHLGRRFPEHADDIAQQAWFVGLVTAPSIGDDVVNPEGWLYRAMVQQVAPEIHRWLSVASISRAIAKKGKAGAAQRTSADPCELAPNLAPAPDAHLVELEARAELAAARVRWRRAAERAARRLPEEVRDAGMLASGIEGDRLTPAEIAVRTGVWKNEVETSISRFRKALRQDPRVAGLEEKVLRLEVSLL